MGVLNVYPLAEVLSGLVRLTSLRYVELLGDEERDASLVLFRALPNLHHLDLRGATLTEAVLRHLMSLTSIQTLALGLPAITGPGFETLSELRELRSLSISSGTEISG